MRTLLTLVFLCLSTPAFAGPIEKVVVFSDRAEVTRVATARCSAGTASVRFENLPERLDVRTLRAEAKGGATALGTSSQNETLDAVPDVRLAELQAQLVDIEGKIRTAQAEQRMSLERQATVAAYQTYFADVLKEDMRNARPDTKAWAKAMQALRNEANGQVTSDLTVSRTLRQLERKKQAIALRIGHFSANNSRTVKMVDVSIKCAGNTSPRVRLSYVVPGATWRPEYDFRFTVRGKKKTGRGTASLTVGALIQQSTGEDWNNAQIMLSTANPQLGSRAPMPGKILVKGKKDGDEKTLVQATERRDKLKGPGGQTGGTATSAELDDGGQSFVLKLPRKVSIRNDGRPYWMPIDRRSLKATSKLVASPIVSAYVHQIAAFKNPAPYPLLAGKMHVYRAGTYIGATPIKYAGQGEPMELALGIDEEVRVKRTSLKKMNRSASFLSSTKHIEHGYRIELENRSGLAVEVEIRERVPVSKIDDVKVDILKTTSKGYALDKHRGFLNWRVALKQGAKSHRDLFFTIHLPEAWKVGG